MSDELTDAALDVLDALGPGWSLTLPSCRVQNGRLELRGALPETMHFGSMRIDLDTGEVAFVDEDHRDGGDFELMRAQVPEQQLERLRRFAHQGATGKSA